MTKVATLPLNLKYSGKPSTTTIRSSKSKISKILKITTSSNKVVNIKNLQSTAIKATNSSITMTYYNRRKIKSEWKNYKKYTYPDRRSLDRQNQKKEEINLSLPDMRKNDQLKCPFIFVYFISIYYWSMAIAKMNINQAWLRNLLYWSTVSM